MAFPKLRKALSRGLGAAAQRANPGAFQNMPGGNLLGMATNMMASRQQQQPNPGLGFFNRNLGQNNKAFNVAGSMPNTPRPAPSPAEPQGQGVAGQMFNNTMLPNPNPAAQTTIGASPGGMRQQIFNMMQKKANRGIAPGGMRGFGKKAPPGGGFGF